MVSFVASASTFVSWVVVVVFRLVFNIVQVPFLNFIGVLYVRGVLAGTVGHVSKMFWLIHQAWISFHFCRDDFTLTGRKQRPCPLLAHFVKQRGKGGCHLRGRSVSAILWRSQIVVKACLRSVLRVLVVIQIPRTHPRIRLGLPLKFHFLLRRR